MSKRKDIALLGALVMAAGTMTACGTAAELSSEKHSSFYAVTIDGEYENYSENDERILAIKEKVDAYVPRAVSRDYRKGLDMSEFDYYTKEMLKEYEEDNEIENINISIKENQIVQLMESLELQEIEFYSLRGQSACTAVVKYIASFESATQSYLERIGAKLNTRYSRVMSLVFIQEDGEWKVDEYTISPREEVK